MLRALSEPMTGRSQAQTAHAASITSQPVRALVGDLQVTSQLGAREAKRRPEETARPSEPVALTFSRIESDQIETSKIWTAYRFTDRTIRACDTHAMSLTSLIRGATPVRERLAAWFPKPKLPLCAEVRVPSMAKNRSLIGTAYDYLLRFQLERAMPFARSGPWAAENALANIRKRQQWATIQVGDDYYPAADIAAEIEVIIRRARLELERFIAGGSLSRKLIRCTLDLAHCDVLYRIGRLDARFGETPLKDEFTELRRLIDVTDTTSLSGTETCLLNPNFGRGSIRLGGADADLLIDDVLIDVKVTINLRLRVEDWRQLIGYAALNEHFPIGGGYEPLSIRRIGVYFARHGYLVSWPLRHVVDPIKFSRFALWLADYATKRHSQQLARQVRRLRAGIGRLDAECRDRRLDRRTKSEPKRRGRSSTGTVNRPSPKIERARVKYRPDNIEWLFIAEAPPAAGGRFFYFEDVSRDDWLFLATMRVLYPEAARAKAEAIRACKADLLRAFQSEGCYLVDACDRPIGKSRTKRAQIGAAQSTLEHKLDRLRQHGYLTAQTKIILVSCTVHDVCYNALFDAGFNVINAVPIEFPAFRHQASYRRKLARLLKVNGRARPQQTLTLQ